MYSINSKFLKRYIEKGTTHGSIYLGNSRLSLLERALWLILTSIAIYFCIFLSMESFTRFKIRSTVVAIDRDYRSWNTTFPSITVCPMMNRINFQKYRGYIRKRLLQVSVEDLLGMFLFLNSLANSSYMNFNNIQKIPEKYNLNPNEYIYLIYNLSENYAPAENEDVEQVLTEWGICYTTNNIFNEKLSTLNLLFGNPYNIPKDIRPVLNKNVFDRNINLKFTELPNQYQIFIHGANEVMQFEKHARMYYRNNLECKVKMLEIDASFHLERSTTVEQRQCRYPHESNLKHFPVYTKSLCQQECRINLAYQLCKCIPHFYPNYETLKPVCHYKKLMDCIFKYTDVFQNLHTISKLAAENISIPECNCLPSCRILEVVEKFCEEKPRLKNQSQNSIILTMESLPHFKYRRQIIFTLTDLLVSIGGNIGFFLGSSVLSFVEVVYYFTLRLMWHFSGYKN